MKFVGKKLRVLPYETDSSDLQVQCLGMNLKFFLNQHHVHWRTFTFTIYTYWFVLVSSAKIDTIIEKKSILDTWKITWGFEYFYCFYCNILFSIYHGSGRKNIDTVIIHFKFRVCSKNIFLTLIFFTCIQH